MAVADAQRKNLSTFATIAWSCKKGTELRRYGDLKVVDEMQTLKRLSRWILFPVVIHRSLHATRRHAIRRGRYSYTVSIANCALIPFQV